MKLLLESTMIFFGTLIAAALVALGDPGQAEVALTRSAATGTAYAVAHQGKSAARPQEDIVLATAAWLGLR